MIKFKFWMVDKYDLLLCNIVESWVTNILKLIAVDFSYHFLKILLILYDRLWTSKRAVQTWFCYTIFINKFLWLNTRTAPIFFKLLLRQSFWSWSFVKSVNISAISVEVSWMNFFQFEITLLLSALILSELMRLLHLRSDVAVFAIWSVDGGWPHLMVWTLQSLRTNFQLRGRGHWLIPQMQR